MSEAFVNDVARSMCANHKKTGQTCVCPVGWIALLLEVSAKKQEKNSLLDAEPLILMALLATFGEP